jgi:hypothetical protein
MMSSAAHRLEFRREGAGFVRRRYLECRYLEWGSREED